MCGICGQFNRDADLPVGPAILTAMADSMRSRGPDDSGCNCFGHVGLAFRRLSIIDLSSQGHQPMATEDDSLWIVYNGETYNYAELRPELEACGHVFRSKTDTEVVLHAYEEYGAECLDKMNGMFDFAIYDRRADEIFFAVDRLGIKPFYYCDHPEAFLFASEAKALLKNPLVNAELDRSHLFEQLVFKYIADGGTLFRNIRRLLPGTCGTFGKNGLHLRSYWDLREALAQPLQLREEGEYLERLDALMRESVALRLRSDVPVGCQLSGGVDSSITTALMAQKVGEGVETFTVAFAEEGPYNELSYAQDMAQRYRLRHHTVMLDGGEFADLLPEMVHMLDAPLNHPNSVGIYQLCRRAKEFVTVLLSGEGADETFAGYDRYKRVLNKTRPWVNASLRYLPACLPRWGYLKKMLKWKEWLEPGIEDLIVYNAAYGEAGLSAQLLGEPRDEKDELSFRSTLSKTEGLPWFERLLYHDLRTYLVSILDRQDKMSMGASVETRVPFLDHRLVEFSARIPRCLKITPREPKRILKHYAESLVPHANIYREKIGFRTPIHLWFADEKALGRYLSILTESRTRGREIFEDKVVDRVVSDFQRHPTPDLAETLWTLVNVELWHRTFLDN